MTRRKHRGRRWPDADDEPVFDSDDVELCGDQLIFVAGRTAAGFAYGAPVADIRRSMEQDAGGAGWARAKRVLRELIEREIGKIDDIGWVKKIGEGVSRDIFAAEVELTDGRCEAYVVALPRKDAEPDLDERTRRELRLIARLRTRSFPFRLPEMVGAFPDGHRLALVRRFVRGIELELRSGRQPVKPWAIVGEIAAAIHAVPGSDVVDIVPGAATRREYALEAISALAELAPVEMRDAHGWAMEHLPPAEPSALLQRDLPRQNFLLSVDRPHHVLDCGYTRRGEPAFDLAIVTRGARRPFQIDRGLERLLEAYREHGGREVAADHVHVYELCLVAGWYRDAVSGHGGHPPAHEIDRMRSLLRRLR